MSPVRDYVDRHFGVKTDHNINPVVGQVETTLTQLLKPNPNRLAWTLINLGSHQIYLGFDQDVSSDKGIYVSATGGVMGLLVSEDFDLTALPLYGIADTAACKIYLIEVFEV